MTKGTTTSNISHLSKLSVALSLGIVWGVGMILTGWFSNFGWAEMFVETMSSCYVGYGPSFWGGIVGGIWGFIDAFIGGFVFAWLFNFFASKRYS